MMKRNYLQPDMKTMILDTDMSLLAGSGQTLGLNSDPEDAVGGDAVLSRHGFNIWEDDEEI